LRRRHAPACHHQLAAGLAVAHDRRRIVGEMPGIDGKLPV
jgi:hypothetical protein